MCVWSLTNWIVLSIAGFISASPSLVSKHAAAQTSEPEKAAVLWSEPAFYPRNSKSTGLPMLDAVASPSGLTLLIESNGRPSLSVGANEASPGIAAPFEFDGYPKSMTEDSDGTFWVGGVGRTTATWISALQSDAILAKVRNDGSTLWQRAFEGKGTRRQIESMAQLGPGEVIVAGTADRQIWLARIAVDGHIVWQKSLGVDKGAAVTVAAGQILLAGFDAEEEGQDTRRENLSLWSFSPSGEENYHRIVRANVNVEPRLVTYYAGGVWIAQHGAATYVLSSWGKPDDAKPLEIVKLDLAGEIAWRQTISESIISYRDKDYVCRAAVAVLGDGDAIVSCASLRQTLLSRFNGTTGSPTKLSVPSPSCQVELAPRILLFPRDNQKLWMLGSPLNLGIMDNPSCTWLTQISLDAFN